MEKEKNVIPQRKYFEDLHSESYDYWLYSITGTSGAHLLRENRKDGSSVRIGIVDDIKNPSSILYGPLMPDDECRMSDDEYRQLLDGCYNLFLRDVKEAVLIKKMKNFFEEAVQRNRERIKIEDIPIDEQAALLGKMFKEKFYLEDIFQVSDENLEKDFLDPKSFLPKKFEKLEKLAEEKAKTLIVSENFAEAKKSLMQEGETILEKGKEAVKNVDPQKVKNGLFTALKAFKKGAEIAIKKTSDATSEVIKTAGEMARDAEKNIEEMREAGKEKVQKEFLEYLNLENIKNDISSPSLPYSTVLKITLEKISAKLERIEVMSDDTVVFEVSVPQGLASFGFNPALGEIRSKVEFLNLPASYFGGNMFSKTKELILEIEDQFPMFIGMILDLYLVPISKV